MGSLKVLTLLLVLLVLVPAGVLAWLGFRSADALDAEVQARVGRELDEVERAVRARAVEAARDVDATMQARVEEVAGIAYRELPLGEPARILERLRRGLVNELAVSRSGAAEDDRPANRPPVWELRLVDGEGYGIVPREYRPEDGKPTGGSLEALLDDLRDRATRRYYEDRDPESAKGVWLDARERFSSDVLRARADVEVALIDARMGGRYPAAAAARRIEKTWSADVLARVGRPMVRLWLLAAPLDPPTSERLREAYRAGALDAVPLTVHERALARLVAGDARLPMWVPRAHDDPEPWRERSIVVRAAVTGGAVLEAYFDEGWAWDLFGGYVIGETKSGVDVYVRARPANEPRRETVEGIEWKRRFEGPAWGGRTAGYLLEHRGVPALVAEIRSRRRLTVVGVTALLLLVVVGIALVGRAVRRERAARRLRDDFIANVSHELRTPLTSVCLHAEMLAEEDPGPERRKDLARVVRAEGARLAALVDDLLDFAALEKGVRTIEPEPLDLAALVRAAVDPYRTLAEKDGVVLDVDVPDGPLDAYADAHGLARILANLLSNAWRHGRPSRDGAPGRIRVRAWEEGGAPTVEVRDDGPGIPAADRAAVFERFRRSGAARRVEGTGLGLALGRELAAGMGADLDLVEDGEQTVFRLTLRPVPDLEEA